MSGPATFFRPNRLSNSTTNIPGTPVRNPMAPGRTISTQRRLSTATPFDTLGTSVNSAFPIGKKIAEFKPQDSIGLIHMSLTSAFALPTGKGCIFVALSEGQDTFNYSGARDIYFVHLANAQNAPINNMYPISLIDTMAWSQESPFEFPQGKVLAIYCCLANDANHTVIGSLNVSYIKFPYNPH